MKRSIMDFLLGRKLQLDDEIEMLRGQMTDKIVEQNEILVSMQKEETVMQDEWITKVITVKDKKKKKQ